MLLVDFLSVGLCISACKYLLCVHCIFECFGVCVCVCFSLSALLVGVSVWEMLRWLCIAWRWQEGPEGWSSVRLLSPLNRLTLQPWLIIVIHQQKVSVPTCLSPLPVHLLLSRTQFNKFAAEWLKLSFRERLTAFFVLLSCLIKKSWSVTPHAEVFVSLTVCCSFCLCPELDNPEARVTEIHALVHRLPEKNRQMLELLMKHLGK